jgi:Tol biopolymer transport system component
MVSVSVPLRSLELSAATAGPDTLERVGAVAALITVVGLAVGPHSGMQVWTGTPSSLGAARLVARASSPVLSPAGRLVAYAARGELRVQPAAGGRARTLTQLPTGSPVAFSPSGTRIAFIAEGAVVQLPVFGKGPVKRVALPSAWARSTFASLAWSAQNGLAFSRTSGDGKAGTLKNELDYVDANGAARVLYRNPTPYSAQVDPVFSPDGSQIVVTAGEGGGLVSVPTGLGRPLALTTKHFDSDPLWSPDGSWLAFQRAVPRGTQDVWLVRPDGTGLRRLTTTPIPPRGVAHTGTRPLAWSPDGTQLLTFRHDRFSFVTVATRTHRELKPVGVQYELLAAAWR